MTKNPRTFQWLLRGSAGGMATETRLILECLSQNTVYILLDQVLPANPFYIYDALNVTVPKPKVSQYMRGHNFSISTCQKTEHTAPRGLEICIVL